MALSLLVGGVMLAALVALVVNIIRESPES